MAKISLYLDTRRKLSNGKYALNFRLSHLKETKLIKTEFELFSDEWNELKKEVKKLSNSKQINFDLEQRLSKIKTFLFQEETKIYTYSGNDLVGKIKFLLSGSNEFNENLNSGMLQEYTNIIIERTLLAGKYKTAMWYKYAIQYFIAYTGMKDIPMVNIDITLLHNYTAFCLSKKLSKNTISVRLRAIRAVLNKARKEGEKYLPNNHKPFENFTIPSQKTPKRAISKETLQKIRDFELTEDDPHFNYRNYFLFAFNTRGMNFVDLAKLKMNQIVQGRLKYTRSKTGKHFDLKITEEAFEILKHYSSSKNPNDYIFPILPKNIIDDEVAISKATEDALRLYNRNLQRLAKRIGIEERLTSYVARHSWATAARKMGVSIDLISESLGHSDLRVTEVYLEGFENEVLDEVNERVTK